MMTRAIHWGQRVSPVFKDRVLWIDNDLGINADDLMDCMAFEDGQTFAANNVNRVSGATGLIQFMPATAPTLGTSIEHLRTMTAEDQLNYVHKYFQPYKGRLHNLGDVYMAILWPAGVGKDDNYALFKKGDLKTNLAYLQNKGLDLNGDGTITRGEAVAKVKAMQALGAARAA